MGTEGMLSPQAWGALTSGQLGIESQQGGLGRNQRAGLLGREPSCGDECAPRVERAMEGQPGGYTGLKRKKGFPGGASGKESTCQCRRHRRQGFDPWVGQICWRRTWQPIPVFFPGESHGQRSLVGYTVHRVAKSWTRLKYFSMHNAHVCMIG